MKPTKSLTADELGRWKLNQRGYLLIGERVHVTSDTGAVYLADMSGDPTETLSQLEAAGWPKVEGEIPCGECGGFQSQLGGLCLRCASNYHGVE